MLTRSMSMPRPTRSVATRMRFWPSLKALYTCHPPPLPLFAREPHVPPFPMHDDLMCFLSGPQQDLRGTEIQLLSSVAPCVDGPYSKPSLGCGTRLLGAAPAVTRLPTARISTCLTVGLNIEPCRPWPVSPTDCSAPTQGLKVGGMRTELQPWT